MDVRVPFPSKMKKWVSFIVKSRGYNINDGTISNLIDLYGDSIAHVVNEIENTDIHGSNDIDELLVKSTILHGKLTEVVKFAEDPSSEKGSEISQLEKKEIMQAIKNLENKILKIKLTIDKK